ncbi:MAG: ATP-binding protein [Chloroflexi bacterium]|nr:ATP-binding protein [Chloroflexota bacterium]
MINPYFPFHALGFRCNPFRVVTDDEWAEIAVLSGAVESAVAAGFVHLQVLGALGHGKTTTLLGLAARFRQDGKRVVYEYLPEGQTQFHASLSGLEVFLLDEAQRLNRGERDRLLSAAQQARGGLTLVMSSHDDLAPLFAKRGLSLTTAHLDKAASPDHLSAVLEQRLSYFALDNNAPGVILTPDAARYLHETFGGNLRAMQYFLYEVFQRLKSKGAITADYLRTQAAIFGPEPK